MSVNFSCLPSAFSSGGPMISLCLRFQESTIMQMQATSAAKSTTRGQQIFGLPQVFSQQGSVEEGSVTSMMRHRMTIRPPAANLFAYSYPQEV